MALSLGPCDDMIAVAESDSVKLNGWAITDFYGTSLKTKEILDSGDLGPLIASPG